MSSKTLLLILSFLVLSPFTPAKGEPAWNVKLRKEHDPELVQAKENAQKRWSLFLAEFKKSQSKTGFEVKIPLTDGKIVEHVWVSVATVAGDKIEGKLDSDPDYVHSYHAGQQVSTNRSAVEDWSFSQGNKLVGGWSVAVYLKRHPEIRSQSPTYVQPK
jgi:uncharacterized protein YegJ (DUF2314 family)